MLICCLSSASRKRYRDDVLRALGLPKGAHLRFRYDKKWVEQELFERANNGDLAGQKVVLSFIGEMDDAKKIIPIRFGRIERAIIIGDTLNVDLALDSFALCTDINQLSEEIKPQDSSKEQCEYFFRKIEDTGGIIQESYKTGDWEGIARELSKFADFGNNFPFILIASLGKLKREATIEEVGDIEGVLDPGEEYELLLYHYHPENAPDTCVIKVENSNDYFRFITSTELQVDSRYDLKAVRFKTGKPKQKEKGIFSLKIKNDGDELLFEFPVDLKGAICSTIIGGVVLGVLIAAPQLSASYLNTAKGWLYVVQIVSSLAIGQLLAFNKRDSV